jgi:hypothetical protein
MKYTIAASICLSLIFFQCGPTKETSTQKAIANIQPEFLTNYTINPAPSGLDSVGIMFSIDAKGAVTTIGNLNLKVNTDSVSVPQEVSTSNVSFKFLLDFLNIKNLDSTSKMSIRDTVKLSSKFRVDKGVKSRFDPDVNLLEAFNLKKPTIISNIKFLGLQKNRLFLIVETIKSGEVNLSNIRSSNFSFDTDAKFRELINLNPGVNITKIRDNSLVYSTPIPRVIFYKLRPINVDVIKGPEPGKINVSLSQEQVAGTLY